MGVIQGTNQTWEARLLAKAQGAAQSLEGHMLDWLVHADDDELARAHETCRDITYAHSRTFFLASAWLPPEKRRAARALYAFCRVTDDLVDEADGEADEQLAALETWRGQALASCRIDDDVCIAWADARIRFQIPRGYSEQLIAGVARDIGQTRYGTFTELTEYAYAVASTVGLMAMHIIGYDDEAAIPYAIRLGVALQLTNILRDVGEDYARGRIYLPQDELAAFRIDEAQIAAGRVDDNWRAFMRFQIARNRRLYESARPGIAMLSRDGRLAITAAADLYRDILVDVERNDYNAFTRRASLSTREKLARMPRIWWRSQRAGKAPA
jgi:15-cis-phytoene synthase